MISNNLLTGVATPCRDIIALHDRQALATVEQWQKTPASPTSSRCSPIQQRLGIFVQEESAAANGR